MYFRQNRNEGDEFEYNNDKDKDKDKVFENNLLGDQQFPNLVFAITKFIKVNTQKG